MQQLVSISHGLHCKFYVTLQPVHFADKYFAIWQFSPILQINCLQLFTRQHYCACAEPCFVQKIKFYAYFIQYRAKKKLSSCGTVTLRLPCDFDRTALLQRHTFDRTQRNVTPLPTQHMRTITVAYSSIHVA